VCCIYNKTHERKLNGDAVGRNGEMAVVGGGRMEFFRDQREGEQLGREGDSGVTLLTVFPFGKKKNGRKGCVTGCYQNITEAGGRIKKKKKNEHIQQ
jgi:hypothetical protein